MNGYKEIIITNFLAFKIRKRLGEFCGYLVDHRFGESYGYDILDLGNLKRTASALYTQAKADGKLGDLVFHIVRYWLLNRYIGGTLDVLVEEEMHKQFAVFLHELQKKGNPAKVKPVLAFQEELREMYGENQQGPIQTLINQNLPLFLPPPPDAPTTPSDEQTFNQEAPHVSTYNPEASHLSQEEATTETEPPPTRPARIVQPMRLRLDAAVPEQVSLGKAFALAVAVLQPDSPKLKVEDLDKVRSGEIQVPQPQFDSYIPLDVYVSASGCDIQGAANVSFRLYTGLDSPVFFFELIPKKLGTISIVVRVYVQREKDALGDARVQTQVREHVVGKVRIDITSHPLSASILKLRFDSWDGDRGHIIWEAAVLNNPTSVFKPPYDPDTLPIVIKALDAVQWPPNQEGRPQFDAYEKEILIELGLWDEMAGYVRPDVQHHVGKKLYEALIADPEGKAALDKVRKKTDGPLSYVLCFTAETAHLAELPWELLRDDHGPLLLTDAKPGSLVRAFDLDEEQRGLPPAWTSPPPSPLHILPVVPLFMMPEYVRASERTKRHAAWAGAKKVEMEKDLSPVTRDQFRKRIDDTTPVHIVHFFGHGIFVGSQGALMFDPPGVGPYDLAGVEDAALVAEQLAKCLSEKEGLGLVVLMACQTARGSDAGPFTSIANALIRKGVPAVVAMQFTVRADHATHFIECFYRALAEGQSIQQAVSAGRQAIYDGMTVNASWYVPTLTIRGCDTGPLYLIE